VTVVAVFDRQAARTPAATAVVARDATLTYAGLRDRAEQLARVLRARGAGPETVVPVLMHRSADLVVAFLAVLKAGCAYQPLHTDLPPARLRAALSATRSPVVLVDAEHQVLAPSGLLVTGHEPVAGELPPVFADQLAYVMSTSGSTGEPKDIAITHRGVVDLATDPSWDMRPHDRVLFHSPHAFDASTWEIWGPLLVGGRVVVAPQETSAAAALRELVTGHGVNRVSLTAGLFRVVAEDWVEALATLSEVTTGGDVISPAAVRRVLDQCPDITVRTNYGPTEATLCVTDQVWRPGDRVGHTVPLGNPMRDTGLHVLDERLRPVPAGTPGELWLSGTGLARGYAGQPGVTAASFVACPWGVPGMRMYRTGDLVRQDDTGLVFLGRGDNQVKINGFRVEPGEVEAALAACAGVRHAAVTVHEPAPGEKRLVAYYVPADGAETGPEDLSRLLADRLPAYLVPADIVRLTGLPLTRNGKVDWKSLPAPGPGSPRQELLRLVFAEVLELPSVGVHDDFFALGGHALLAPKLVARVRSVLHTEIDVPTLYDNPTVALLDRRLAMSPVAPGAGQPSSTVSEL
jgi:nonribosomal peptide synthetase DhbF